MAENTAMEVLADVRVWAAELRSRQVTATDLILELDRATEGDERASVLARQGINNERIAQLDATIRALHRQAEAYNRINEIARG